MSDPAPLKHIEVLMDLSSEDWARWRNHPVTSAYLAFLADQVILWREVCADLVINGAFHVADANEDRNPDVVRGKVLATRQLRDLDIATIQQFYRDRERSK